jgi:hypothetical protein
MGQYIRTCNDYQFPPWQKGEGTYRSFFIRLSCHANKSSATVAFELSTSNADGFSTGALLLMVFESVDDQREYAEKSVQAPSFVAPLRSRS